MVQEEQVIDEKKAEAEEVEATLSADDLQELSQLLSDMIADIEAKTIEEMKPPLEHQEEEAKAEVPVADTEVVVMVPDRMCGSELNTELMDGAESETVETDSTAHAVAEEVTEVEQAKVSKRKKKRSKAKVRWPLRRTFGSSTH